jgi:hypothetical protein
MDKQKDQRCVAVDFDGTLAEYEKWEGPTVLGEPIPEMVNKIKQLLSEGVPVVIFTARVNPSDANPDDALSATQSYLAIADWCQKVFGELLPITHEKSRQFTEIWDDRAKQVFENTGVFLEELMDAAHSDKQPAVAG